MKNDVKLFKLFLTILEFQPNRFRKFVVFWDETSAYYDKTNLVYIYL